MTRSSANSTPQQLNLFPETPFPQPPQLPTYEVRVSDRAKHVSIRVSHLGTVEVVIPRGFDRTKVPEIVKTRQEWIRKTTRKVESERQRFRAEPAGALPDRLILRALSEEWQVIYKPTGGDRLTLRPSKEKTLSLSGATHNEDLCRDVLRRWLTHQAQQHLSRWLQQLSQETRLSFNKVSIRGQKTRWGSCSDRQSISLNYKLLFLPPELVRYVLIHELCHTVQMNHSRKFWQLVAKKEPDYERLDQEVNKGWRYVPEWVDEK